MAVTWWYIFSSVLKGAELGTSYAPSTSKETSYDVTTFTAGNDTTRTINGVTYDITFVRWEYTTSTNYPNYQNRLTDSGRTFIVDNTKLTDAERAAVPEGTTNGTITVRAVWAATPRTQPDNYTVTTAANPGAGGTTTGDGQYAYGSTCILSATPANGYEFVRWVLSTGATPTSRDYSFTVTQDTTATAYFRQYTNLLLHGSSNTLLHGSSGTLLHDS